MATMPQQDNAAIELKRKRLRYLQLKRKAAMAKQSQAPSQPAQPAQAPQEANPYAYENWMPELHLTQKLSDFGEQVSGPVLQMGSAMAAEPIAGLAGIAASDPLNYMGGGRDAAAGTKAINDVREAMTWQPKTENQRIGIEKFNKVMKPVAEGLHWAEQRLGDLGNEYFGPTGGAIGSSLPTAALIATGSPTVRSAAATALHPIRKITGKASREQKSWLKKSAPTPEELKQRSQQVYNALDNSGVVVPEAQFDALKSRMMRIAQKEGAAPGVTDKVLAALRHVDNYTGNQPLSNLDIIRKTIKNATSELKTNDSRIAYRLMDEIDDFADNLNLGESYRNARALWHRAMKGDRMEELMQKAANQASGFENGLRSQFRSVLNSPKKRRGYNEKELDAMRSIVHGTTPQNILKQLGKFGISFDQSSSMLLASLGFGGATAIGGTKAAMTIVGIGTAAREWAKYIANNNAQMASAIARSGSNAESIVKNYLKYTPKKMRRERDLTALLIENDPVGASQLRPQLPFVKKAVFYADLIRSYEEKQKRENAPPMDYEQAMP